MDWIAALTVWGLVPLAAVAAGRFSRLEPADAASSWMPRAVGLIACLAMGVAFAWTLGLPPFTVDDWWYAGLGFHQAGGDLSVWLSAWTEHVHPREPTVRPLTYNLLGVTAALAGGAWWGWHAVTLALHCVAAWLLYRVGALLFDSRRAGLLGAIVWWIHPAHAEVLAWLSAIENALLAALFFGALLAWLRERALLAAALASLAIATKESGTTVIGAMVLIDLVRGRLRWRALVPTALVVAASFGWRALLHEPENEAMAAYLADMAALDVPGLLEALFVTAPTIALQPFAGLIAGGPEILALACAVAITLSALAAATSGQAETLRWLVFGAVWALGIALPAARDLELPSVVAADVAPPWKLRHLYLALAGPALTAGWLLTRLPTRAAAWLAPLALVAGLGALLVVGLTAPVAAGERVVAAAAALDRLTLGENVGVRVVEPEDPIASLLLYRRLADPAAATRPLLIGEPRCGRAAPPLASPPPGLTLRGFSEWLMTPHTMIATDPGGTCTCPRWRPDAAWIRWRAGGFRPD